MLCLSCLFPHSAAILRVRRPHPQGWWPLGQTFLGGRPSLRGGPWPPCMLSGLIVSPFFFSLENVIFWYFYYQFFFSDFKMSLIYRKTMKDNVERESSMPTL